MIHENGQRLWAAQKLPKTMNWQSRIFPPSHDGTVFSKKKINFVTKAIDIVVDGIEKNS